MGESSGKLKRTNISFYALRNIPISGWVFWRDTLRLEPFQSQRSRRRPSNEPCMPCCKLQSRDTTDFISNWILTIKLCITHKLIRTYAWKSQLFPLLRMSRTVFIYCQISLRTGGSSFEGKRDVHVQEYLLDALEQVIHVRREDVTNVPDPEAICVSHFSRVNQLAWKELECYSVIQVSNGYTYVPT
jgi:hypothetical protein